MNLSDLASRLAKFGLEDEAQQEYACSILEDDYTNLEEKVEAIMSLVPYEPPLSDSQYDELAILIEANEKHRKETLKQQAIEEAKRRKVTNAAVPRPTLPTLESKPSPEKPLTAEEKSHRDRLLRE